LIRVEHLHRITAGGSRLPAFALLSATLILASCGSGSQTAQKKGAGGPPQVGFVVVQPGEVPVVAELTGRVNPYQVAEIRPQVAGIIRKRFFTEGTIVRQGQTLYQIRIIPMPSRHPARRARRSPRAARSCRPRRST